MGSLRSLKTMIYVFYSTLNRVFCFHFSALCRQWNNLERRLAARWSHTSTVWICIELCSWRWRRTRYFLIPLSREERTLFIFTSTPSHSTACLALLRLHRARLLLPDSPRPEKYQQSRSCQLTRITAPPFSGNSKFVCTLIPPFS